MISIWNIKFVSNIQTECSGCNFFIYLIGKGFLLQQEDKMGSSVFACAKGVVCKMCKIEFFKSVS